MSDKSKKNPAVSPVIGTILLVAITVVLIAIITAVVMGLADAEDGKKVGMNAQPDKNETAKAKLILYGGESISELVKLEMIDHDSPNGEYVLLWEGPAGTVSVGVPYPTKEDVARPPEDMKVYDTKINVRGTFTDGREVVLLVQPMTFYDVKKISDGKNGDDQIENLPIVFAPSFAQTTTNLIEVTFLVQNVDYNVTDIELHYRVNGTTGDTVGYTFTPQIGSKYYRIKINGLASHTNYDFWGVAVRSGKTSEVIGPERSRVTVATTIDKPVKSGLIYANMLEYWLKTNNVDSAITSIEVHYRKKDTDEDNVGLVRTPVIGTTNNNIKVYGLKSDTWYEFWGVGKVSPSGEIIGNVSEPFKTSAPKIETLKHTGLRLNYLIEMTLQISSIGNDVSSVEIRYKEKDTDEDKLGLTVPYLPQDHNQLFAGRKVGGLKSDTWYEFWCRITLDDGRTYDGGHFTLNTTA